MENFRKKLKFQDGMGLWRKWQKKNILKDQKLYAYHSSIPHLNTTKLLQLFIITFNQPLYIKIKEQHHDKPSLFSPTNVTWEQ